MFVSFIRLEISWYKVYQITLHALIQLQASLGSSVEAYLQFALHGTEWDRQGLNIVVEKKINRTIWIVHFGWFGCKSDKTHTMTICCNEAFLPQFPQTAPGSALILRLSFFFFATDLFVHVRCEAMYPSLFPLELNGRNDQYLALYSDNNACPLSSWYTDSRYRNTYNNCVIVTIKKKCGCMQYNTMSFIM